MSFRLLLISKKISYIQFYYPNHHIINDRISHLLRENIYLDYNYLFLQHGWTRWRGTFKNLVFTFMLVEIRVWISSYLNCQLLMHFTFDQSLDIRSIYKRSILFDVIFKARSNNTFQKIPDSGPKICQVRLWNHKLQSYISLCH